MNATRVSNRAGRRLGMLTTAILVSMLGIWSANAAVITATVTGTLNGGNDTLGVFGMRRGMPKGTPYVIVFSFDDTMGAPMQGRCPGGLTGIAGVGKSSPGTAVLTINGKSYEFGNRPDARSQMLRSIESPCSHSSFGMSVQEGHWSQPSGANVQITPDYGGKSLTQDKNWRDPISLSNFMAKNGDNAIFVRQPGNYAAETMSYLSVSIVTIDTAPAGTKRRVVETPAPPVPVVKTFPRPPIGPEITRMYILSQDRDCKVTGFTPSGQKTGLEFSIGTGVSCTGMAIDASGRFLVSSMSPFGQLKTFEADGRPTKPQINGGAGAAGITLDGLGRLFLLMPGGGREGFVRILTPELQPAAKLLVTHLSNVDSIAVDPGGKVYVVSQGYNVVKTYDADGQPAEPTIKAGVNTPRAVAVGPDGKIYVANYNSVTTYLPNGQIVGPAIAHINPQEGGPDMPMGLAVDSRGKLYIGYWSGLVWEINPDRTPAGQAFMTQKRIQAIAVR